MSTMRKSTADKGYKSLTFKVTQDDIDHAIRQVSTRCAVAVAVKRAVPEAVRVWVDIQTVRFTAHNKRYTYLTPRSVQDYIVGFDAGDNLTPFNMRLVNPHVTEAASGNRTSNTTKLIVGKGVYGTDKYTRVGGKTPPIVGKGKNRRRIIREFGRRQLRENAEN